jgi:hypothetical protein
VARADSVIKVSIIGDAQKLIKAFGQADAATGGVLKSGLKVLAATKVIDTAFDTIGDFVKQGDRVGDALSRIQSSLGDTDAAKLKAIAGSFTELGVSAPDFLELTASFSEFASATGNIKPDQIFNMASGVGELAGAMARLHDMDPEEVAKAAALFISGGRGAEGAAKLFGIDFDKTLTPFERYSELMAKLPGLVDSVTGANAGLDDKQSELNAKWETFESEVGPAVEGVLSDILTFILDEIDAIPGAVQGWQNLGKAIEDFGRTALGPLGNVRDALEGILNLLGATRLGPSGGAPRRGGLGAPGTIRSESGTVADTIDFDERNGGARTVNSRIGGP